MINTGQYCFRGKVETALKRAARDRDQTGWI